MKRTTLTIVLALSLVGAGATAQEKVGKVSFQTSCSPAVQADFDRAVAMLHSFWFQASVNVFAEVVRKDPACGMAHWGIAMNLLGNPFGWPPSPKALADGWAAVERAKAAGARTERERGYVAAVEAFYKDAATVDHRTRALAYLAGIERVAQRYADDREASIFYALALNATALPTDKTYANQLKAAGILEKVFAEQPQHPGVAHYLIHSYDYPPIAEKGLDAARRYAGIAPAAPHALHMPSHIFTRRGHWQDSIESNRASAAAAAGNQFNQFHAMDYLAYAYLQTAQDQAARRVLADIREIQKVTAEHFVAGFALAAIPSRYALERGRWSEAAALTLSPGDFPWSRFPQSESQLVFARGLGAARSGDVAAAKRDADRLQALRDALTAAKQGYWAEQTEIQRLIVSAWAARAEGKLPEAFRLLRAAVEREDATEKHPVTPGPLAPARELLSEMLLETSQPAEALREFEATMRVEPNRFRTVAGAARAAELAGDTAKARSYYAQLVALAEKADGERPEVKQAKAFLGK